MLAADSARIERAAAQAADVHYGARVMSMVDRAMAACDADVAFTHDQSERRAEAKAEKRMEDHMVAEARAIAWRRRQDFWTR